MEATSPNSNSGCQMAIIEEDGDVINGSREKF